MPADVPQKVAKTAAAPPPPAATPTPPTPAVPPQEAAQPTLADVMGALGGIQKTVNDIGSRVDALENAATAPAFALPTAPSGAGLTEEEESELGESFGRVSKAMAAAPVVDPRRLRLGSVAKVIDPQDIAEEVRPGSKPKGDAVRRALAATPGYVTVVPNVTEARVIVGKGREFSLQRGKPIRVPKDVAAHLAQKNVIFQTGQEE